MKKDTNTPEMLEIKKALKDLYDRKIELMNIESNEILESAKKELSLAIQERKKDIAQIVEERVHQTDEDYKNKINSLKGRIPNFYKAYLYIKSLFKRKC